jgi:hypothetical protein
MSRYLITNSKYEVKPTVQMPAVIVNLLALKCSMEEPEPVTERYPCFNKPEKEFVYDCKD